MNPIALIWLQFALCVAVIGVAGVRLSRYGDAIATLTGLSRNWVGLILLATVTSLPELVTGLSAVTVAAATDIAVGDVLGSCVFNLAILAMIDVTYRQGAIYALAGSGHVMSAGFGVILLAGVGLAVLLTTQGMMPVIGHVSFASLAIFVMYLVAMRALYLTEQRNASAIVVERPAMALKAALMGYGVASCDCGRRHMAADHRRGAGPGDGLVEFLCWNVVCGVCHLGARVGHHLVRGPHWRDRHGDWQPAG